MSIYYDIKYKTLKPLQNLQRAIGEPEWKNYKLEVRDMEVRKPDKNIERSPEDPSYFYQIGENTMVCKFFGCGQMLTRREYLFGDYCIIHNKYHNKKNQLSC